MTITTQRKKLTVFFSDIKDFISTTEDMQPEDLTALLNHYLTEWSLTADTELPFPLIPSDRIPACDLPTESEDAILPTITKGDQIAGLAQTCSTVPTRDCT